MGHNDGHKNCCSEGDKNRDKINNIVEVETEANSAIFIRAGPNGVPHFVSSLKVGYRSILKFVFIREGSDLLDDARHHVNQFSSSSPSSSKKNNRGKSKGKKKNRKR